MSQQLGENEENEPVPSHLPQVLDLKIPEVRLRNGPSATALDPVPADLENVSALDLQSNYIYYQYEFARSSTMLQRHRWAVVWIWTKTAYEIEYSVIKQKEIKRISDIWSDWVTNDGSNVHFFHRINKIDEIEGNHIKFKELSAAHDSRFIYFKIPQSHLSPPPPPPTHNNLLPAVQEDVPVGATALSHPDAAGQVGGRRRKTRRQRRRITRRRIQRRRATTRKFRRRR